MINKSGYFQICTISILTVFCPDILHTLTQLGGAGDFGSSVYNLNHILSNLTYVIFSFYKDKFVKLFGVRILLTFASICYTSNIIVVVHITFRYLYTYLYADSRYFNICFGILQGVGCAFFSAAQDNIIQTYSDTQNKYLKYMNLNYIIINTGNIIIKLIAFYCQNASVTNFGLGFGLSFYVRIVFFVLNFLCILISLCLIVNTDNIHDKSDTQIPINGNYKTDNMSSIYINKDIISVCILFSVYGFIQLIQYNGINFLFFTIRTRYLCLLVSSIFQILTSYIYSTYILDNVSIDIQYTKKKAFYIMYILLLCGSLATYIIYTNIQYIIDYIYKGSIQSSLYVFKNFDYGLSTEYSMNLDYKNVPVFLIIMPVFLCLNIGSVFLHMFSQWILKQMIHKYMYRYNTQHIYSLYYRYIQSISVCIAYSMDYIGVSYLIQLYIVIILLCISCIPVYRVSLSLPGSTYIYAESDNICTDSGKQTIESRSVDELT